MLVFDELEDYIENNSAYLGAVIGHNTNRIKDSTFTLDGTKYQVEANDGGHKLHSGSDRYNTRVRDIVSHKEHSITVFINKPPHLNQGFPGELKMEVSYELTEDNVLEETCKGHRDSLTVFNPVKNI